jgi:hypothetical protein
MLKLIVQRGSKYWGREAPVMPEGVPSRAAAVLASSRSEDNPQRPPSTLSVADAIEESSTAEPTPRPSPDGKWLNSRSKKFLDKTNFQEMYENAEGFIKAGQYDDALRVLRDLKVRAADDPDFDLKHTDSHIHDIEQRVQEETRKKVEAQLAEEELLAEARAARRSPRAGGPSRACDCCGAKPSGNN